VMFSRGVLKMASVVSAARGDVPPSGTVLPCCHRYRSARWSRPWAHCYDKVPSCSKLPEGGTSPRATPKGWMSFDMLEDAGSAFSLAKPLGGEMRGQSSS
jgi:hypothetical protein